MIAEYLTRRDAEIYASELAQLYGPEIHFDVVSMPDPVFGDTVGTCLALPRSMARCSRSMRMSPNSVRMARMR
jgi:hypothetical protein